MAMCKNVRAHNQAPHFWHPASSFRLIQISTSYKYSEPNLIPYILYIHILEYLISNLSTCLTHTTDSTGTLMIMRQPTMDTRMRFWRVREAIWGGKCLLLRGETGVNELLLWELEGRSRFLYVREVCHEEEDHVRGICFIYIFVHKPWSLTRL